MAIINVLGTWNAHGTRVVGNKEACRVVNVRGELPAKGDGIASEEPPAPWNPKYVLRTVRSQEDVVIAGHEITRKGKLMEVVKIERLVNHP